MSARSIEPSAGIPHAGPRISFLSMRSGKRFARLLALSLGMAALCLAADVRAQGASPLQSGHYSPVLMNVRDMAYPPAGLFILWYNPFLSGDSYRDRNGDQFKQVRLSDINNQLPDINVDLELNAFATVPTVFWASNFKVLGGARYLVGVAPSYVSADVSVITERAGIGHPDTTFIRELGEKNSGFSDLMVTPVGLSWGWEKYDLGFMYSFYAPTGTYDPASGDVVGLGFWTHQFQGRGYLYPRPDKSTAIMLGGIYEVNGKIKDVDVTPGNRFTLEWGLGQYFSERVEAFVQGGHNWQISDDSGADVYWDSSVHDRKNTIALGATVWPMTERLAVTGKYAFDFGARQRFENNTLYLNLTFVPNWLTGH